MALVTGRDCDLTVATHSYKGVVNSFTLNYDTSAVEYQTLGGPLAGPGSESGTLDITFAYDSGETNSLFDALWTAATSTTAGANEIAYVATVGKSTFTGHAIAVRPPTNATAGEVSEVSVSLALNGMPTKAAVVTP